MLAGVFLSVMLAPVAQAGVDHFPAERVQQTIQWQDHVKANPQDPRGHFELAMVYALTGRVEKGLDELKVLSPNYATQLIAVYQPLSEKEPDNPDHKFKLAFAYYFSNRPAEAKAMFQRILDENDPNYIWAMGYKALVFGNEGKNDEAIELCRRALDVDRDAAGIWFLLGEATRRKGDSMKGIGNMVKALRLRGQDEFKWKQLERDAR